MKFFKLSIFVGFMTLTSLMGRTSHAIFDPTWDRPIEAGLLKSFETEGAFRGVDYGAVTLTRQDESLEEKVRVMIENQMYEFKVTQQIVTFCGDVIYETQPIQDGKKTLRLVYVAGVEFQICLAPQQNENNDFVEITMIDANQKSLGFARFQGKLEPVFTIQ